MKEPNHFDLVPADFTGDMDFQLMNAEQRGIYCTVLFYMYQKQGYCNLNSDGIATLCRSAENFEKLWPDVEKKFIKTKKGFTHKRVLKEYEKSCKRMQSLTEHGLAGAKKRWGGHSQPNGSAVATKYNTKEQNITLNNTIAIDSKNSLSFELPLQKLTLLSGDEIEKILPPRNDREKATLSKVICHIAAYCREGRQEQSEQIFQDVIALAKKAASSNAGSRKALFVSWIKNKYGFNSGAN